MAARFHATMTAAVLLALVWMTGLAGCAGPSPPVCPTAS